MVTGCPSIVRASEGMPVSGFATASDARRVRCGRVTGFLPRYTCLLRLEVDRVRVDPETRLAGDGHPRFHPIGSRYIHQPLEASARLSRDLLAVAQQPQLGGDGRLSHE